MAHGRVLLANIQPLALGLGRGTTNHQPSIPKVTIQFPLFGRGRHDIYRRHLGIYKLRFRIAQTLVWALRMGQPASFLDGPHLSRAFDVASCFPASVARAIRFSRLERS